MPENISDLVQLSIVVDPLWGQNCYVLLRRDTHAVLVIDPGLQHGDVIRLLDDQSLTCSRVLITHGHPDHVSGVPALLQAQSCSAAIHPADRPLLDLVRMFPGVAPDSPPVVCEEDLTPGERIEWQGLSVDVLHTPGHTPGSVCFLIHGDTEGGRLLSGDTLFRRSVGRTDLPGGSWPTLAFSIEKTLYTLPPDTVVYPGHGAPTSVGEEMLENPFIALSNR